MHKFVFVFLFVLAGCGTRVSSSTTTSSLFGVSTQVSSVPTPLEFNKTLNGKTVLIDHQRVVNFSRENNLLFDGERLSPINYRELDEGWMPYEAEEEPIVPLTFNQTPWSMIPGFRDMPSQTVFRDDDVISLLESWLQHDGYFNEQTHNVLYRNLSHDVLGDPYYWFNNYIDTYEKTIQRFDDSFLYADTSIQRQFQTGNAIAFQRQLQREVTDISIIDIQDDTFPVGFFGAVDRKITTPRSGNNALNALSLGPATFALNTIRTWQKRIDDTNNDVTKNKTTLELSIIKINETSATIELLAYHPRDFRVEQTWIEERVSMEINQLEWSDLTLSFYLWETAYSEDA
jgi:hypothetical protein